MSGPARLSEFELIARVFAPLAGEGTFGLIDDAAIFRPPPGCDLVLTKDALTAEVHFFASDPWFQVAQKGLRVNLSDLAAKGAEPAGYLLGLGLPAVWSIADIDAFGAGLAADQEEFGIQLFGGDTIRTPERLTISITAIGTVPHGAMVRRGGARPGDRIVVTGTIGDAALGLVLRQDPDKAAILGLSADDVAFLDDRYLLPQPRVAAALAVRAHASGAMDVSDGLIGDLAKMAAASGVAITVDADRVPLSPAAERLAALTPEALAIALTGGDDYEIAASVPEASVDAYLAALAGVGIDGQVIGSVTVGEGITVIREGTPMPIANGSFRHF